FRRVDGDERALAGLGEEAKRREHTRLAAVLERALVPSHAPARAAGEDEAVKRNHTRRDPGSPLPFKARKRTGPNRTIRARADREQRQSTTARAAHSRDDDQAAAEEREGGRLRDGRYGFDEHDEVVEVRVAVLVSEVLPGQQPLV